MSGFCPDTRCILGTTLAEIQVVDGHTIPVWGYCEYCNPHHLDEDQWAAEHQEEIRP